MDISELLRVGEHIIIEYGGESYKTIVQDVFSDRRLLVSEPTIRSIPIRIPSNAVVDMVYILPDCSYRFQAEMNGLYVVNHLRLLRFFARTDPVRSQRRSYYRLPIGLTLTVNINADEDGDNVGDNGDGNQGGNETTYIKFSTYTIDISEGGLSFLSENPYPEGMKLYVAPLISRDDYCDVEAEVVRCVNPTGQKLPYVISVKFVDCPENISGILRKFIINEQIKRLRLL